MKRNKRNLIKIEDLNFDLGNLYNEKATLEWKIDKEQKFIIANFWDLGSSQIKLFEEMIIDLQKQHAFVLKQIQKQKEKILEYEKKSIR